MRVGLRLPEGAGGRVLITDADGEEIGHIDAAVNGERLEVRWIEVDVSRRRWGLGMDAVRAIETEAVRRWGVRSARAEVPLGTGLALYFWLRLGYRPLGVQTEKQPDNERMLMVRELKGKAA
jgi:hypothetical protein